MTAREIPIQTTKHWQPVDVTKVIWDRKVKIFHTNILQLSPICFDFSPRPVVCQCQFEVFLPFFVFNGTSPPKDVEMYCLNNLIFDLIMSAWGCSLPSKHHHHFCGREWSAKKSPVNFEEIDLVKLKRIRDDGKVKTMFVPVVAKPSSTFCWFLGSVPYLRMRRHRLCASSIIT